MSTALTLPDLLLSSEVGYAVTRAAQRDGHVQVRPGAYVQLPSGLARWDQEEYLALARCVALHAQLSADVTFSHVTAALLHGLLPPWELLGRTHVYQDYSGNGRTDPSVVRHAGLLPGADRTEIFGMSVTTLARTAVDCARTLHPRHALAVVDRAIRVMAQVSRFDRGGSLQRMEEIRAELSVRVAAIGPGRGVVRARAVIGVADGLAESPGESGIRWIALSAGLPAPELQLPIRTRIGYCYVDGAWQGADWLLAFEYDGGQKYGGSAEEAAGAVIAEKDREDAIREEGADMLRFRSGDLTHVRRTLQRICARLPDAVVGAARKVPGLWLP